MCEDGSCIARVELCPEEQLMNQNTILIMIVVGLAVVVFLVILYCFQQRQRRANREYGTDTGYTDECDNASLYAPPPDYEEVINSDRYPATPETRRLRQLSIDEPRSPMTPPPNYDTALVILAMSQDSVLSKPRRHSSIYRRSMSVEQMAHNRQSVCTDDSQKGPFKQSKGSRRFFRFSRQFSRTSTSSTGNNMTSPHHSPLMSRATLTPPPYPQTPPIYPLTPPPPLTPLLQDTETQNCDSHSDRSTDHHVNT